MVRGPLGTVRTRPSARSISLRARQKLQGKQIGLGFHHQVEEPALIGEIHRLGFVDG